MKEGLIERLQSDAHWRVNLVPLSDPRETLTNSFREEMVRNAKVSLRGWSYPFMSNRNDEFGGAERQSKYLEFWTDWGDHAGFWRLYKSGQFLSYTNIPADHRRQGGEEFEASGYIDIIDAIYTVSEFFFFALRLYSNSPLGSEYKIDVSLRRSQGRVLDAGINRMPFSYPRTCDAPVIEYTKTLDANQQSSLAVDESTDCLLNLFDMFGWSAGRSQIKEEVEKFVTRGAF